jgi:hypothetical protein
MEKQHKHLYHLCTDWMWHKVSGGTRSRFTALEQSDILEALEQIEEQDHNQEFFRLIRKIRESGEQETDLTILPAFLETNRERALYEALMGLIEHNQHRTIYST